METQLTELANVAYLENCDWLQKWCHILNTEKNARYRFVESHLQEVFPFYSFNRGKDRVYMVVYNRYYVLVAKLSMMLAKRTCVEETDFHFPQPIFQTNY